MESQVIEPDELSDNIADAKPSHCIIAWFAIALLLITWLSLFFGITFFWKKNNDTFSSYKSQLTQTQAQLTQTQTKYQELQNNLNQIQALIQKKISSNNYANIQLSNIRQLIQQAQNNLLYLQDPDSALSALTLAEKQLAELPPSILLESLHTLLAQNIASLKTLPHIDLNKALAQLDKLQTQVTQLPLISRITFNDKEIATPPNAAIAPERKWVDAIQSSLRNFQQLIIIRHLDKPIEPLLPQAQQQYLQHNLQLLLQQAQWALLYHQEKIYHTSLQHSKEAIQRHFVVNAPATQVVIQAIDKLEKLNIQPNLPDLVPTLTAVDSLEKTISTVTQKEFP